MECPHENGDIESANGHLKRRLATHLTLRGSRDFGDEAAWGRYIAEICVEANALRTVKVAEERSRLRPLPAARYPEADEARVRVSSFSTVRVKSCAYSVPARLIGAMVQVQISEAEVIVRHEGYEVVRYPRTIGHQASAAVSTQKVSAAFFCLIFVSTVGNFFAGWLAKQIGNPRAIALLFFGLASGMIGSFAVNRGFAELAWFWLPAVGFFSGVFGLFSMYLPPLFPTLLRTTGAGFCYNIGRLAAAAASLVFGWLAPV